MAIKSGPYDLNDEVWREYSLNEGRVYRIEEPCTLWVGDTTHRVMDNKGIVHCVPFGPSSSTILKWKPRDPTKPIKF